MVHKVPFKCLSCGHTFDNVWIGYTGADPDSEGEDLPRVWELYECPSCGSRAIMSLD